MIICDPRNAPRYAWMFVSKASGLKWWIKGLYEGSIRYTELWETRPWGG